MYESGSFQHIEVLPTGMGEVYNEMSPRVVRILWGLASRMRRLSKGAGEGDERENRSRCHPENQVEAVFQGGECDQLCQGCRRPSRDGLKMDHWM